MALKAKLDTLEGVPADVAKEYKEVVDGDKKFYTLDVEGAFLYDEDPGALKRAKDHEKKGRQDAEKKAKDHEGRIEALQNEIDEMRRGNIPKGDVEKLEKSWKDKLEGATSKFQAELTSRDRTIQYHLVDNIATRMANEISAAPDLILPHIKNRLSAELQEGQFVTRVLDKDGKPSALSIEELQKEISQDKRFSLIIKGSGASGGGASGGGKKPSGNGSGAPVIDLSKPFDWNKATHAEIAAYNKAKKAAAGGHTGD